MHKDNLTIEKLINAAQEFCSDENLLDHSDLRKSDGKTIRGYVERRLKCYIADRYEVKLGKGSKEIVFPAEEINTHLRVTSRKQPQSSCPYKSSHQKVFGLGYNLLILVYNKIDEGNTRKFSFLNCTFVPTEMTADSTTTQRLIKLIRKGANQDVIFEYFINENLPGKEIELRQLADEVINRGIMPGYFSMTYAPQWRLNYEDAVSLKNNVGRIINRDYSR